MKQKLTVLACVGLALLLSTGFAFAQNTITVESKDVNRCATVTVAVTLDNLDNDVECIGLPLVVTGGTLTGVAAGADAGPMIAINHVGNRVLANRAGSCLAMAGPYEILILTIDTPDDCSGTITIGLDDPSLVPSSGLLLADCGACEVPVTLNPGTLTLVNQAPICGANSDENLHFEDPIVDKHLNASDPDPCDGFTFAPVSGPGDVSPDGLYNWDPDCTDVGDYTVTFRVTDDCGGTVDCTFDVTVYHDPPICQPVADQTVHWADHLSVPLPAEDDDCPMPLTWTLLDAGGLVGALSVSGGNLEYDGDCDDIPGPHLVTYEVDDGDLSCQGSVNVSVTNTAPTVICPDIPWEPITTGDVVNAVATVDDADFDPLTCTVISFTHVGGLGPGGDPHFDPTIDNDGNFQWITWAGSNEDLGDWEACIEVSDGCYTATCCFEISVVWNFKLCIGGAPLVPMDPEEPTYVVDTVGALNGEIACVYIDIHDGYTELGGFDLLISYDLTGLSLTSVAPLGGVAGDVDGDGVVDGPPWEYFTYRTSANSNCSGGCPSGLLRIVSIADLDDGPTKHPATFNLEGYIAEICFLVTSDRNYIDQCLPVCFESLECGDNTIASVTGDTLYAFQDVDSACVQQLGGAVKKVARPVIDWCCGSICVREPPDDRGDINLNGIANEVGDAVVFSNYFINGGWGTLPFPLIRALASDVNNDDIVLTIADLVYLIRIITGDEQAFPPDQDHPKVSPYAGQADAFVKVGKDNVSITTNSAVNLGGALFVFRYSGIGVGEAVASEAAANMVVRSRSDRGELRVLVAPNTADLGTIEAGTHEVVSIPTTGEGTIDLVEVQLADAHGAMLTSSMAKISPPKSYALMQNYPNPFNAGTVIRFDLSQESDWTLQVYNITGQVVRTFSGHDAPSTVSVTWDGANGDGNHAASGVYFYRINAGEYTATKKMTLLK